jgi:EF hand
MRHGRLVLVMLVMFGATFGVPAPIEAQTPSTLARTLSTDDVVARMLAFDRNDDGRLERAELNDRMHPLLARGDANGDGALDGREIRTLSHTPRPVAQPQGFPISSGYAFGDEIGLSSRSHIEGALDDLRLAGPTRERVLAIVTSYVEEVEKAAAADVLAEMDTLLPPGPFLDFKAILSRQNRSGRLESHHQVTPAGDVVVKTVVARGGTDLARRIDAYGLPPETKPQAVAAAERYQNRVRLGVEAERSGLLERLASILSREEVADLGAALGRRPVVARNSDLPAFVSGHGINFVVEGKAIVASDRSRPR